MNALVATMACDVRIQMRNGFYWAVAFLLGALLILVTQLPPFDWRPVLPPLVLGNLALATFFFLAALVLLEKGEGTLEAQVVTPLTETAYLTSKIVTLTALSVAESVLLVGITGGWNFRFLPLVLGIVSASVLYCLAGFVASVRYESINECLLPTMVWVTLFSLPILDYAGVWSSALMFIHPFQASLVLLSGAFRALQPWEWIYGIVYSGLWIALGFVWSRRAFQRFVVARVGAR